MSQRSQRKEEHLALAQMFFDKQKKNSFDQMHLVRPALPESKADANKIVTEFFNKKVAAPFFIEAMTGGSQKSLLINRKLGKAAAKTNIALALGSASILAKEPKTLKSFEVAREEDPDGVVIVNVNPKTPIPVVQKIIRDLKADALQIHLNAVQEAVMPEGDRNFYWLNNLLAIRQAVTEPIIIKEVGFGFDQKSLTTLMRAGFDLFDLAGSGGTNFAQIENQRNSQNLAYLENIGLSTVVTSLIAEKVHAQYLVSGGVRNPLDVFKGLCLGGKMVGVANTFLHEVETKGSDGLIQLIQNWQEQLAIILSLYGQNDLSNLTKIERYYDLPLKNEIEQLI